MRVRVKICGLTRPEDAALAVEAGADLLGFVFVAGTPRVVDPPEARWIRDFAGRGTVGVFRDASPDEVLEVRRALALDWVQLHGDESDSMLELLGERVLRRIPVHGGVDWRRVVAVSDRCVPLIDPGAGDGVACDWTALGPVPEKLSFGIAGGLHPGNVGDAVRILRPTLVDVSSGVEQAPRVKDPAAVYGFVRTARAAAAEIDVAE